MSRPRPPRRLPLLLALVLALAGCGRDSAAPGAPVPAERIATLPAAAQLDAYLALQAEQAAPDPALAARVAPAGQPLLEEVVRRLAVEPDDRRVADLVLLVWAMGDGRHVRVRSDPAVMRLLDRKIAEMDDAALQADSRATLTAITRGPARGR